MIFQPMSAASRPQYSIQEYVSLESRSNVKHEFLDGEVWAMAGGTPEHAAIASNIIVALGEQLRGKPCRVYTSDVRVRVVATGLDTYPDVTVVCGGEELDRQDTMAIVNPIVLVEVTSDGTEGYDRGKKLEHYQRVSSLREIVTVAHTERRIDVHSRADAVKPWTLSEARERAELRSIACALVVEDVYRNPFAS